MALLKGTSLRGFISPRVPLILTPNGEESEVVVQGLAFRIYGKRTDA